MTFHHIPPVRPSTPLLDRVNFPAQLRQLSPEQLPELACQLREYLLYSVGQSGGHFGAGLGVVELTIALHYVYNTPEDRLVWDVGHQTYPHKILTGRREQMTSIRQQDGLSGFPKRSESEYDTFGVGHSSTSISAALGMALAAKAQHSQRHAVAIIGDGAMTAGMAFEALTHAGHTGADMLVVLNDNDMSISHNIGGLSTYFSKIWASRLYNNMRQSGKKVLAKLPPALDLARKTEGHMKGMVGPATFFEDVGFNYIGPLDGHNLPELISALQNLKDLKGPQLLHIKTVKGKGFAPAEADPIGYHALSKIEVTPKHDTDKPKGPKYQDVFGQWLIDMAATDARLIGITPAMSEGSGMVEFAEKYPERYHDVAIAEQHAVTLAAGLACEGMKPVVAIYSTFLQRAYDQYVHDVALQHLDVLFAIDRAGLVGEDGATHAGAYDLSFLRCIPDVVIMAPADENECRQMLYTGYQYPGTACVRYPRGQGPNVLIDAEMIALPIGKGRTLRHSGNQQIALLNFGALLERARTAADALDATLADMRFVKPLDEALLRELATSHQLLVTLEENTVQGGAGAAVSEWLAAHHIATPVLHLGLPDTFLHHGQHSKLLDAAGLSADAIVDRIKARLRL